MRSLRPAAENDVTELIELARRSWLSAFAQTAPWPLIESWVTADRTSAHYRKHWRDMLVLEEAGRILGLVQPLEAEINGLWVHPAHQGTGAGTRLLHAGEEAIRAAGYATAWLHCSAFNPRALAFYAKRGYVETRRASSTHPTGLTYVDIRMERAL
ncbi:MAG TPA: GNAT family N-acetyltransferase [Candidatus Polarisedimenticolaceae bacterium]|nr:GNAT family N-acetyltransferase [Candidatus Polarisedimenticolaceae bacterium]